MGPQRHHIMISTLIAALVLAVAAGTASAQDADLDEWGGTDAGARDELATVAGTGAVILLLVVVIGIPLARAMRNMGDGGDSVLRMRRRYHQTCQRRRAASCEPYRREPSPE